MLKRPAGSENNINNLPISHCETWFFGWKMNVHRSNLTGVRWTDCLGLLAVWKSVISQTGTSLLRIALAKIRCYGGHLKRSRHLKSRNDAILDNSCQDKIKSKNFRSQFSLSCSSRFAFTLSEILITLGIIGVIAAITIPNLIANYRKDQTVTQLKKAYTTISQAVKQSEIDNGPNQYWDWGTSGDADSIKQSFDTYWAPYLRIMKKCNTTYTDCGYSSGMFMALDGDIGNSLSIVDPLYKTTVILTDGTVIMVRPINNWIVIDLNGTKQPNVYGKDVFLFVLDPNKGFMPYGYERSIDVVNDSCAKGSRGGYCAAKIIRDGWKIADDYPWN